MSEPMRKHIGNICPYISGREVESPEREKLRRELIIKYRTEQAERNQKKHENEIHGNYDPTEVIRAFFDDSGSLPPTLPFDTMVRQFHYIRGQMRWVRAIFEEMHTKLKILDPERYEREQAETEQNVREKTEAKKKRYEEYMREKSPGEDDELLKLIHWVIKNSRRSQDLRRKACNEMAGIRITGVGQVETALRYLFAEYITNPEYAVKDDPVTRYTVLKREADWLEIVMAELETNILVLGEIVASGHYLQETGRDS